MRARRCSAGHKTGRSLYFSLARRRWLRAGNDREGIEDPRALGTGNRCTKQINNPLAAFVVSCNNMKLFLAFFQLIRSLNLFFIVLTQALFYYCVFPYAFQPP